MMSEKIQPYVSSEEVAVDVLIPRALVTKTQNLISLLSEYYSWMAQEGSSNYDLGNLHKFRNVDNNLDEFLSAIADEMGHGFDASIIGNKTNVYKHLKEIYVSKGTRKSVELIFKLLFDDNDVRIHLPKDYILKASDGRWQQDVSIFVQLENGVDILDLYGGTLELFDVINNITNPDIILLKHVAVDIQANIYELFTTRNFVRTLSGDVDVYLNGIKLATAIETVNDYEILIAGTGFYPGFSFVANTAAGRGLIGKVTSVSDVGAIENISFMSYGVGYNNNEIVDIVPSSRRNIQAETSTTVDGSDVTLNQTDALGGFLEDLQISADGADRYFDDRTFHTGFYTGTVLIDIIDDRTYLATILSYDPATLASVRLLTTNTVVNKYNGYFKDNKGFLSDDLKLQDNFYYQNFSYVIRAEHAGDTYYDYVLKNTHTAGMIFFSEYKKSDALVVGSASLTTQVTDTST